MEVREKEYVIKKPFFLKTFVQIYINIIAGVLCSGCTLPNRGRKAQISYLLSIFKLLEHRGPHNPQPRIQNPFFYNHAFPFFCSLPILSRISVRFSSLRTLLLIFAYPLLFVNCWCTSQREFCNPPHFLKLRIGDLS